MICELKLKIDNSKFREKIGNQIENLENIWKTFGNDLKIWQKDLEIWKYYRNLAKKIGNLENVLNLEKIGKKLEIW